VTILGHSDNGIAESTSGLGMHFFSLFVFHVSCFISETAEWILSMFGIVTYINFSGEFNFYSYAL
jgi:hypothetical protein